jgi:hypothetical protein
MAAAQDCSEDDYVLRPGGQEIRILRVGSRCVFRVHDHPIKLAVLFNNVSLLTKDVV